MKHPDKRKRLQTRPLPMGRKSRVFLAVYSAAVLCVCCMPVTASAAGDPLTVTQNVEYLLDSVQASTMLSNSEMLILLNQAPSDREKLAALLNISPEQTGYITNAPAGCGLLRYGGALVPFRNQFPKDTELYRLMTTKPDESIIVGGKTK